MAWRQTYHATMDEAALHRQHGRKAWHRIVWRVLAVVLASLALISIVLVFIHLSLPVDSEWKLRPEAVGLASLGIGCVVLCCLVLLGWFLHWGNHWAAPRLPGWALWPVGILSVLAQIAAVGAAFLAMFALLFLQDDMRTVPFAGQTYYIERTYPSAGGQQPVWRAVDPLRIVTVGVLDGDNTRIAGLDDDHERQLLDFANDRVPSKQDRTTSRQPPPNDSDPGRDSSSEPQGAADRGEESKASVAPAQPTMAERCANPNANCYQSVWTRAQMDPVVVQDCIDLHSMREGSADPSEVNGSDGRWALMTLDAALGSRWTVLVERVDDRNEGAWRFVSEVPTTSIIERAKAYADVIEITATGKDGTERLKFLLNAHQWQP